MNELFAESLEWSTARLHAYCYMTNHVHALIQVGEMPLGRIMLRVAGQYARTTQARLITTGHLFEKRYHPVLVDTDSYLRELVRYIHLNPVRSLLASSPLEYPWTSHHAYLGVRAEPWVTTDFALSMFGASRATAVASYESFVHQALYEPDAPSPLGQRNSSDPRILGSDDFARRMLGAEWQPRSKKSLEQLIADACQHFCVTMLQLRSASREPKVIAARAWVANEAVRGRVASVASVAREFNRDESSLRRALRKRFAVA